MGSNSSAGGRRAKFDWYRAVSALVMLGYCVASSTALILPRLQPTVAAPPLYLIVS